MEILKFDLKTLYLAQLVTSTLFGAMLWIWAHSKQNTFTGIMRIGLGFTIFGIGMFLSILQKDYDNKLLTILSLNTLILAFMMVYEGLVLFMNKQIRLKIDLFILFISFALEIVFTFNNNLFMRITILSVYAAYISTLIAYMFYQNSQKSYKGFYRFSALFVFMFGLLNILRIFLATRDLNHLQLLGEGNSQEISIVLIHIFILIFCFGFIFMLNSELIFVKDRFLSILSHELTNRFSAIIGFSNILSSNKSFPIQDQNRINFLHRSANSGYYLLTNLLEWSKNQFGKGTKHFQILNINDIIKNTIDSFTPELSFKKIKIYFQFNQEASALADKEMITLVIRNLISNAIKYSNIEGEIDINIDKIKSAYLISVTDSGEGMTQHQIDDIMSNKTLFSKTGTKNEKGNGLGLYLAKMFIEQHGGSLQIKSYPHKGSTFSFTLPYKEEFLTDS